MNGKLTRTFETPDGAVRWDVLGEGEPVVLLHGTPFSSLIWRDIAPALARDHRVHLWDLLGFGQSEQRDGQDVGPAAQAKVFTRLLEHWGLERPRVIAHDIGGAVALRAMLLHGARYADLTLVDAVACGEWGTGFFRLVRENAHLFEQLPDYAHKALVESHLRHATHTGYRPDVLSAHVEPWRGERGRAAYYRQYRQAEQAATDEFQHLLGDVPVPTRIIWGREDRFLPAPFAEQLHALIPHSELHWIEGAGHTVQEDAPAQLLALLTRDFLPADAGAGAVSGA
ncbi:alpha/beta fold hydrolase [Streptomyces anulatus]|uniref:alpha/beta fold hydrolase n=1 Tax=Streptomyces anulatus TaxID=1892 RepID=UPI003866D302|nr:alpha/beta hydrolase [Streptomyces anulatus]WSU93768.1 alpha/beta hydrolase [Streptomyces anulatus]